MFNRKPNSVLKTSALLISLVSSFLFSSATLAGSETPGKVIAGYVEKITVKESGRVVKAKLDSGAATSSIHAKVIKKFKKGGKRYIRFELLPDVGDLSEPHVLVRERVRKVRIKDNNGGEPRYVVNLEFCFNGRLEKAEFTLAEREKYIYPVLLGREFLAGVAIIDSELSFLTQAHCPDEIETEAAKKAKAS